MYYVPVPTLAQRVFAYIRRHELLKPGDRVGVAVSGGADSVALLRLLLELRKELGIVLSVVHFNHKLRGAESDEDEQFVVELARRYKLQVYSERGEVAVHAAEKRQSVETAARELRYRFFRQLLLSGAVHRIATAHTLDDQAETVLLRLVRGAGTRGLSGIYPQLSVASSQFSIGHQGLSIIRPLLGIRRKDLEACLTALGQAWREDRSNRDLRHARNRVRHGILPRLERNLNPAVREVLAETAEIAREEEAFWQQQVNQFLPQVCAAGTASLHRASLVRLPLALQRRMVRAAGQAVGLHLEFGHVEDVLQLLSGEARSVALPTGWLASRSKTHILLEAPRTFAGHHLDYDYLFPIPGRVDLAETASRLEAVMVSTAGKPAYNPEHLLEPTLLAKQLRVRNWRPGDRFWPAHTKSPKKVKELLQERHITGPDRMLWPVVLSGSEIVWLRGFPVPASFRPKTGTPEAVLIRESALKGARLVP